EGNLHIMPGLLRSLLDGGAATEDDQIGERDFLPSGLRGVELPLDTIEGLEEVRQLGRLVDLPILLRREADARPVRPTALVGAAESCRRRPSGRDQLRDRNTRRDNFALE